MSQYYFNPAPHSSMNIQHPFSVNSGHQHHGARTRRGARYTASQASNGKQFKGVRTSRESAELVQLASFRRDFEAARSFDFEDDEIFCPYYLLTEDDLHSMHSTSDRSSSASNSPESSPLQNQLQPTPTFALSAPAQTHQSMNFPQSASGQMKIHQPMAQRTRNAIPIVDPNSRNVSPPNSVSPARQEQKAFRRW